MISVCVCVCVSVCTLKSSMLLSLRQTIKTFAALFVACAQCSYGEWIPQKYDIIRGANMLFDCLTTEHFFDSQTVIFPFSWSHKFNLHFLPDMLHKLNTCFFSLKKGVEKWLFCQILALSSVCCVREGWDGEGEPSESVVGMWWVTLTGWFHSLSSDSYQRGAQSLPFLLLNCRWTCTGWKALLKPNRSSVHISVQTHNDSSQLGWIKVRQQLDLI